MSNDKNVTQYGIGTYPLFWLLPSSVFIKTEYQFKNKHIGSRFLFNMGVRLPRIPRQEYLFLGAFIFQKFKNSANWFGWLFPIF
ncbi:MAG: hypothetical protein ACFFDN_32875 [Candidatus Hodarchaeota archaeon]